MIEEYSILKMYGFESDPAMMFFFGVLHFHNNELFGSGMSHVSSKR